MSTPVTRLFVGCIALTILFQTGCTLLAPSQSRPLPNQVEKDFEGKSYVVILTKGSKKTRHQMPWKDGMFLQDVIDGTRVRRRFNHMLVEIKRPRKDGVQTIPLKAKYEFRNKRLSNETNYAVHPGDFVMITDDSKSALDQLVDGVTKFVR